MSSDQKDAQPKRPGGPLQLAAPGLDLAVSSAAPAAAARFYVDLLGAEPVADPTPWRADHAVAFGGQVIAFRPAARIARSQPGGIYDALGPRVIGVRVAELGTVCAGFAARGRRVAEGVALPGQRAIRFAKDPDGCMLELIGAGPDAAARPRLQVGLTVADATASRRFYRDTLGLPEQPPAPISKDVTRYGFDVGGSTLKLWQPSSPAASRPDETEPGLQAVMLRIRALPEARKALEARGARPVAHPDTSPRIRSQPACLLRDPDGNRIELID